MTFNYQLLTTDFPVSFPVQMVKFKCLILIERPVGLSFQLQLSRELVENGCLFAMSWGRECSSWDDSIDYAAIDYRECNGGSGELSVMTTWHEDETLEEVIEFAKHCTEYSDIELDDFLVLDLGPIERGAKIREHYLAA